MIKKILSILLIATLSFHVIAESSIEKNNVQTTKKVTASKKKKKKSFRKMHAVIKTSLGDIKAKLFFKKTPKTVENFVSLAEGTKTFIDPKTKSETKRKFYDGLIFHRVIPKFMIQAGCPIGDGTGGPGYTFQDEFRNDLKHNKAGILSMANRRNPNTNGSQFFITAAPTPHLDGQHTVFGEVVEGIDVVMKINSVRRDRKNDRPIEPITIKTIEIIRN